MKDDGIQIVVFSRLFKTLQHCPERFDHVSEQPGSPGPFGIAPVQFNVGGAEFLFRDDLFGIRRLRRVGTRCIVGECGKHEHHRQQGNDQLHPNSPQSSARQTPRNVVCRTGFQPVRLSSDGLKTRPTCCSSLPVVSRPVSVCCRRPIAGHANDVQAAMSLLPEMGLMGLMGSMTRRQIHVPGHLIPPHSAVICTLAKSSISIEFTFQIPRVPAEPFRL